MRFFKNGQLQDNEIIDALHKAAEWYEDGAIVETRDLLVEIVDAIDEFDKKEDCENPYETDYLKAGTVTVGEYLKGGATP